MRAINSVTDARVFVENSGVAEWTFGGNATAEGFAEWLFRNRRSVNPDGYNAELIEYLISVGQDPSDYR